MVHGGLEITGRAVGSRASSLTIRVLFMRHRSRGLRETLLSEFEPENSVVSRPGGRKVPASSASPEVALYRSGDGRAAWAGKQRSRGASPWRLGSRSR